MIESVLDIVETSNSFLQLSKKVANTCYERNNSLLTAIYNMTFYSAHYTALHC